MASPLGPRSTALVERLGGVHRRGVMGSLDALSWFFAVFATSSLAFVESYKAFEITDALTLATVGFVAVRVAWRCHVVAMWRKRARERSPAR